MFSIRTLLILIPALPLAATLITAALGPRVLRERSHWPAILALLGSFIFSAMLVAQVCREAHETTSGVGYEQTVTLWTWADVPEAYSPTSQTPAADAAAAQPDKSLDFNVEVTLRADPLTAIMLAMVTFVSTLVIIYSAGYMHGDPGYWRFFTYLTLFVFSMTMLVSVSNFVLLYCFWEAVGVCSYLLIGFWYQKPEAAAAGKKAFLVNRIGDFGFALGVFLIWTTYGTLNFHDAGGVPGVLGQTALSTPDFYVGGATATAIGLLLMLGACGKSAQFPLHVWLPDAMEGPTPVSALIHAATMVTAGVYMVARCSPLYLASVDAQMVVAMIGGFTALLAGLIALTQNDLKRVLAYSTVSQLGLMFLGLGMGTFWGIVAGMFHLFTHAFFKALLFLGAGSVMHAMGGVIDMRQFGGLRRIMPITHKTFLIGCLALAGIVPFAGFWSKDLILAAVHDKLHHADGNTKLFFEWLYYGALFTSFLTALYTFRAFFMTFYGRERIPPEAGHHAHESPPSMTVPLVILAVCAAVVGAYFEYTQEFTNFLALTPQLAYQGVQATHTPHEFHLDVALTSTMVAVTGIALAAFFYLGEQSQAAWLAFRLKPLYRLSYGKFFFDQIYYALIVAPLLVLAQLSYWFDRYLIDGLVNAIGAAPAVVGALLRSLQTGMVQLYALLMVLGLLVLVGTLLLWPGG